MPLTAYHPAMKIFINKNPISAARYKSAQWWEYQDYKNQLATEIKLNLFGKLIGGIVTVSELWPRFNHRNEVMYPTTVLLCLKAKFYRETNRVSDIDNLLKMAMDVLQTAGIIYNDDQIREVHATVEKGVPKGRFEIELDDIKK